MIGMSNFGLEDHNFGVNVNLHLRQPGNKKDTHYARVKIYKKNFDESFEIALNEDPSKMEVIGKPFLRGKNLGKLIKSVKKYRIAFLMFWKDEFMTNAELKRLMKKIDKGELK